MNVYKEMYLQLSNKVSDIIKELQDVQTSVEEIYNGATKDEGPLNLSLVASLKKKTYRRGMSTFEDAVSDFAKAVDQDKLDIETLDKLDAILKAKRNELEK